jgi:hypothetical protein
MEKKKNIEISYYYSDFDIDIDFDFDLDFDSVDNKKIEINEEMNTYIVGIE